MQTRMATNSILNTEKKIKSMQNSAPTENKKSVGLLSRSNNDTIDEEQNDLAVDLKLKIRKMFEDGKADTSA
tara:strand:+ start:597 stop:812 length:216 start_codon:yes stop_codon:yes gene_type:complete